MYLTDEENLSPEERKKIYRPEDPSSPENPTHPVLDLRAVKEYPGQLLNKDFLRKQPAFHFPIPEIQQAMAFQIEGHAMEELIRHQDYVIGTHVPDLELVEPGNIYVVVTANQVICRRLSSYDGRMLTFKSDNPEFGTKGVSVVSVKEIWWVKHVLSGNMRAVRPVRGEEPKELGKREFEHRVRRGEEEKG